MVEKVLTWTERRLPAHVRERTISGNISLGVPVAASVLLVLEAVLVLLGVIGYMLVPRKRRSLPAPSAAIR